MERSVGLFREWGEAHYALAIAYRRLGRQDDAERAMAARLQFGAMVPAIEDPVLATTSTVRDDAVASLERGVKLESSPATSRAHSRRTRPPSPRIRRSRRRT